MTPIRVRLSVFRMNNRGFPYQSDKGGNDCPRNPLLTLREVNQLWDKIMESYQERKWEFEPIKHQIHQLMICEPCPQFSVALGLKAHRNLITVSRNFPMSFAVVLKIIHGTILMEELVTKFLMMWPRSAI